MKSVSSTVDLSRSDDDPLVVRWLDEVKARLEAGEPVDLEDYCRRDPTRAERLRRLLPAVGMMADLARVPGPGLSRSFGPVPAPNVDSGVLGDFRILREVGRGGMGVVYEAEQLSLGRRVALKILPFAAALDPRQLQRFQLEAQAAACLHHTHIVPVFAVGTERGVPFYAMQLIEGRNLAQLIAELRRLESLDRLNESESALGDLTTSTLAHRLLVGTPTRSECGTSPAVPMTETLTARIESNVSPRPAPTVPSLTPPQGQGGRTSGSSTRDPAYIRTVARFGQQAADALDHAHTRGILHRDIKPGNLLVDVGGGLWITDFGLAQVQGDHGLTRTGDILGTLRYMSPEQVLGKRVVIDGRTDLYSLGVTLYELLTLRPAFTGRDRVEILHRIGSDEPTPLRKLNPAVPRDLATVVHKAMAKEPDERYATAHDLVSDLGRFLESRPIAAVPPNLAVRAGKWMRRHREATLAMLLIVAAVAVAASASVWDQSRRSIQLGHKVERLLGAAKASLQSADIGMALRHLAEARGHLTQARYGKGPLTQELDSLAQAASARSSAEDRFRQFQELRRHAHGSMNHLGADSLLSALEQGRVALSLYRVTDADPWEPPKAFHDLPASRQVEAREGILELLFLTARMEIKSTYSRKDREQAHRHNLDALGRIEAIQGPSSATSAWMAWNWEALGDRDRARQEDRRAEGLGSQTALEEMMLAELMSTRGRPEDALAGYDRALRRRSNHLPSLFGEVRILVELKRYEAAEALLTGVIALAPESPFAYSIRGQTRLQMGKYDAALVDFQKLAELNPDDHMAYYNQGHLLNRQGDHEHAVAMFNKALKLSPNSFSTRLNRGVAYSELGRNEEAYADFTHVIDKLTQSEKEIPLDKDWERHLVQALMSRGLVAARLNRRDEALTNFNEVLQINPKQAMAYHRRAEFVWTPAGRFQEAVEDFSRAIEIEPDNERHWRCRANCFAHFGDNARADEDMTRVVELKPDLPSNYLDRADLRVKRGELQAAMADTERALGLPDDVISKVDLYNAACVSALAAAHVSKDESLPERESLSAKYADRAVELLRRAVAKGWAQPADLELMSKDSDLDSIRHHPGFEDLLRSIHSAGHPVLPSDEKPRRPSLPRTGGSDAGSIFESESDLVTPLQEPDDPLRSRFN